MSYIDETGLAEVTTKLKTYIDNKAGGGEDSSPALIDGTITEYIDTAGKIKEVKYGAFADCYNLSQVSFPNCTIIRQEAFMACSSLISAYFPEVLDMRAGVFRGCVSLLNLTCPKVRIIGASGFLGCYNLENLSLSDLSSIYSNAFSDCYKLSRVSFPCLLTAGGSAFASNTSLTSVYMPNLSTIAFHAFDNCVNLDSIEVMAAAISSSAFLSCSMLQSLYLCTNSCQLSSRAFDDAGISTSNFLGYYGSIYVPSSLVSTFKTSTNWVTFSDRIAPLPSEFESKYVYAYEFNSDSTLTQVPSVKETALAIGAAAFQRCSNLLLASFPNCETINFRAFASCYSLSTVYFPNVKYIAQYAFNSCLSLTEINFPKCLDYHSQAFTVCSNVTSINLPLCSELKGFNNLQNLVYVNCPDCEQVLLGAFQSCTSLPSISLPKCKKIGSEAFRNCNSLSRVVIGTALSTICELTSTYAFTSTPLSASSYLGYYGSIYVPDSLVSAYKAADKWSWYSDRIIGISNLPSV